jgi:hypothetical protein
MLLFQLEADGIVLGVSDVRKAFGHTQHKEDRGVDAHRDTGLALLNLDECRPADRGALGHDRRRNAPPAPRIANVVTQFA